MFIMSIHDILRNWNRKSSMVQKGDRNDRVRSNRGSRDAW